MKAILILAGKEIRDGLRNRWVAASAALLVSLSLAVALLGSAPVGTVGVDRLAVTVVGLSSLTIYLVPLIALMLAHDAVVGEDERGTLLLLLTYPVRRSQVILGKFLGHTAILAFATVIGFGVAGAALMLDGSDRSSWHAFAAMTATSILLGCVFLAIGYLASVIVRERATAAGAAVLLWLGFTLIYDLALLALLVGDKSHRIGASAISALLLFNPADIYRLLNLTGFDHVSQFAGLTGIGAQVHLGPALLVAALLAWIAAPMGAVVWCFRRREA